MNQGGNGNPTATIGHEPERTTVHGVQGVLTRQLSRASDADRRRRPVSRGADLGFVQRQPGDRRGVAASAAGAERGDVQAGRRLRADDRSMRSPIACVSSERFAIGGARYEARAADSPSVGGAPLWPDDSPGGSSDLTFRASAVITPDDRWAFSGFAQPRLSRAAHDRPRHARADRLRLRSRRAGCRRARRQRSGRPRTRPPYRPATRVEQVGPETQPSIRGVDQLPEPRLADGTVGVRQQHLRQHPEAGVDPAAGRGRPGARRPADHLADRQRRRVRRRHHGAGAGTRQLRQRAHLGHRAQRRHPGCTATSPLRTAFTYLRATDTTTHLPPNIEGGTPAPQLWVSVRYAPAASRWWVEPYATCRLEADAPVVARSRRSPHRRGTHPRLDPGVLPQRRARPRLGHRRRRRHSQQRRRHADRHGGNARCRCRTGCSAPASIRHRCFRSFRDMRSSASAAAPGSVPTSSCRCGEPDRRELSRHQLGGRCTGSRGFGSVHHAVLRSEIPNPQSRPPHRRSRIGDSGLGFRIRDFDGGSARDGAAGSVSGNHTTGTAALFVNAAAGDLHLRPTATALLNRIVMPLATPNVDWDGQLAGGRTDIGADVLAPDAGQPSNGSADRPLRRTRPSRVNYRVSDQCGCDRRIGLSASATAWPMLRPWRRPALTAWRKWIPA